MVKNVILDYVFELGMYMEKKICHVYELTQKLHMI